LRSDHFVNNLLIDKMRQECGAAKAHAFVISFECFSELHYKSIDQKLSNLRKFGIDDCSHSSIDWREWQTRCLSFHNTATEKSSTSDQILIEQFRNDVFYVRDVDLVDQSVNGLFEGFPRHALELF
jgi:hypothetical protein